MTATANDKQVGGQHYREFGIEPWDFIIENELSFLQGNAIKYICRVGRKGDPLEDIDKAIHYLEKLREELALDIELAELDREYLLEKEEEAYLEKERRNANVRAMLGDRVKCDPSAVRDTMERMREEYARIKKISRREPFYGGLGI